MSHPPINISDRAVGRIPYADQGQFVVRDIELAGFVVVVGRRTKTFSVHSEIWQDGKRKAIKRALGIVGQMPAKDARRSARAILASPSDAHQQHSQSSNESNPDGPVQTKVAASGVTFRQAWERYRLAMRKKNRSERTIESYRDHVDRLFADWLDKPIRDLGNDWDQVASRHDQLTNENGPYIANGALRTFRAIYNHAWLKDRTLPAGNPAQAIDWNEEQRRNTGIGPRGLPAWFDELMVLENPIRREFHLFTLLSGCRPGALKQAEVQYVDFRRRVLHIPAPKGGAKKAFDIPLSRAMVRCLIRAIRLSRRMHPHDGRRWIFAADSASGHIVEHKEDRDDLSKWGNDLRQSYRTCGQVAKIPGLDIKLLMNHALPGVNEDYITVPALLEDHLRGQQEAISQVILGSLRKGTDDTKQRMFAWLNTGQISASVANSRSQMR